MVQRIGKYEVVERIGRGGMGTIFKARDPVLERLVALKVLSSLEVTPELRARFFREAQACARLSHPNIVTIYDMGEDDGRLFIVMELLEGEELRQLIARRPPLALEDRLGIALQICDGLYYAHQRGVVHRDIKPANILLLRSGQVKILDFGIAQLAAATQGELTRTGMIMGTLRYMAPEQVRGRADHRSDIFSVGAVSYELFSGRPPFTGEDPLQILEQIRTETPPRLSELDPSLPLELAAVVARAMQRDPGDRYPDLGLMSEELQLVQRALAEEAERVGARVLRQREELERLRQALAERVGAARQGDPIPGPPTGERRRLATLQGMEHEIGEQIGAARSLLARMDALAPAVQHARRLLEAGQFVDAVHEFEAIVADAPEYAFALEGLAEARAAVERSRREQVAGRLVEDARAALADDAPALCLELLAQAAEIAPALQAVPEIAALRERAQAALAAEDAARRAAEQAEAAREEMARARASAQGHAPAYAPTLWNEAETRAAEAHAAFGRAAHAEALAGFAAAEAAYRRFEEAAREARQRLRATAESARQQASEARDRARGAAPQHARESWEAAEAKAAEAEAILASADTTPSPDAYTEAVRTFEDAAGLYRNANDRARDALQVLELARAEAERARDAAALARSGAAEAHAPTHAREEWEVGESVESQANAALARQNFSTAQSLFADARRRYAVATQTASIATEAEARRADAMLGDARRLMAAGDTTGCLRRLDQVLALRPDHGAAAALRAEVEERRRQAKVEDQRRQAEAEDRQRQAEAEDQRRQAELEERRRQAEAEDRLRQTEIEDQRRQAQVARQRAPAPGNRSDRPGDDPFADTIAQAPAVPDARAEPSGLPTEVMEAVTDGQAWVRWLRLIAIGATAAAAIVGAALYLWPPAAPPGKSTAIESNANAPSPAAIEELRNRLSLARGEAARAGAETLTPALFAAALKEAQEGDLALGRRDVGGAQQRYREAIEAFGRAKSEADRAGSLARAESEARELERRAAEARRSAEAAGAPRLAPALWAKANSTQRQAEDALRQRGFDQARRFFGNAEETYREATKAASAAASAPATSPSSTGKPDAASLPPRAPDKPGPVGVGPSGTRAEAEQAQSRMTAARRAAEQVAAGFFAHQRFTAAQGKEREGVAALRQSDYGAAIRLFGEAQSEYQAALPEAKRAADRDLELAPLKAVLEQAHAAVDARRKEALTADAERLARDAFDQAQVRQVEGDRLAARQDLAAAAQAYRDAAERYGEAIARARAARSVK